MTEVLRRIYRLSLRECGMMTKTYIYLFCMFVFPVLSIFFFTSIMESGLPMEMPVGIVDQDNTTTTRSLIRRLDGFQTSRVVAHYPSVDEARRAIQRNEIYAFVHFPKGTTSELLSARRPKIAYYYSNTSLSAGALLMRDMKTMTLLGNAAVGQAKLRTRGATDSQVRAFLQPIALDLHTINNPWTNYNVYISTFIIPGVLLLFIFLISAYSIGTELKFDNAHDWIDKAGGNIYIALIGKFLPQALSWLSIFYAYSWFVYGHLEFPHNCGIGMLLLLPLITVLAGQAFGIFVFGLTPSLRMSMSICSLWAVLSFSTCGAAFPVFAMDAPIEALATLFPLRHYYMIYQMCIFNGYQLHIAWFHFMALGIFICLPFFVTRNIKKAMLEYVYIP
ncbi:MAG: ABC transporter permease [Prevotella sp.]|nr:ABC transporter permease [Prevotella sp.]